MQTSVFQSIGKRTKRAYLRLFDAKDYLFGRGTETTIFPNGTREIWIQSSDHTKGFAITASNGPAGFSVRIRQFGQSDTIVHSDWMPADRRFVMPSELEIISYYGDAYAQGHKAWYFAPRDDQRPKHPSELGIKPRNGEYPRDDR